MSTTFNDSTPKAEPQPFEHVFSGVPNTKRHRAALEALKPFLNTDRYRMRVRGRTPNSPENRTHWGDVDLDNCRAFSVYLDDPVKMKWMWDRIGEERKVRDHAEATAMHLDKALTCAEANASRETQRAKELMNELQAAIRQEDAHRSNATSFANDNRRMRATLDETRAQLDAIPRWVRWLFKPLTEKQAMAMALAAALVLVISVTVFAAPEVEGAGFPCTTDTECSALCQPDDEECDGGPQ